MVIIYVNYTKEKRRGKGKWGEGGRECGYEKMRLKELPRKENHDSRVELFNRSVSNPHRDNLSKEQKTNYLLINHYRGCKYQIIQIPERENQKKTEENNQKSNLRNFLKIMYSLYISH